jgi:hypothetical protein
MVAILGCEFLTWVGRILDLIPGGIEVYIVGIGGAMFSHETKFKLFLIWT